MQWEGTLARIIAALPFLGIALVLYFANERGYISSDALKRLANIATIASFLLAVVVFVRGTSPPSPGPVSSSTPTPTVTHAPPEVVTHTPASTATVVPMLTPTPTCPYQTDTDAGTIIQLIQAEGEAVNNKDLSIIRAIFAKDAVIRDALSPQQFNDPVVRYTTLFHNTTYRNVTHYAYQPAGDGSTETSAWFTTGSEGEYLTTDNRWEHFTNPPGSDHWTFGRDPSGCWVIVEFTFNAEHVRFPP